MKNFNRRSSHGHHGSNIYPGETQCPAPSKELSLIRCARYKCSLLLLFIIKSNSDSLFAAHFTVKDWRGSGKNEVNESRRQKLGR